PDRFLVRKSDLHLVERTVSDKRVELVRDPRTGRNLERALPPERRNAPSLTDDQVRALAELGRRTERHYGRPQDIEFAVEAGRPYLVQARPVTTSGERRPEAPSREERPAGEVLVRGLGASPGEASGRVRVLRSPQEGRRLEKGDV